MLFQLPLEFAFSARFPLRFSTGVCRRVFRRARPSSQSPRPLALFICPASPIITNSLPHFSANVSARESVTYGSLELATTILRNRSRSSGIGAKPLGPDGKLGASGSLGATRSAPRMRLEASATAQCAQRASGAVRHKHCIRTCERDRLIEPRDPVSAVRCFPIVLNYAKQRLVSAFPQTLPMSGVGVMKSRKNERARQLASPGAADTLKVPSTTSTKVRSSRRMTRLATAVSKFLRASGSAFSFFR